MIENCKVCGADKSELTLLWEGCAPELTPGGPWWRCRFCASDSSETRYVDLGHYYTADYHGRFTADLDWPLMLREMENNVAWFGRFRHLVRDNTFLDIGSCEGAGMAAMQQAGWAVAGFDVNPSVRDQGSHVIVAYQFKAALMPRRYSAIQCREVLEHVEDWKDLLIEMGKALLPGGVLGLQTPRPGAAPDPIMYQTDHLQLFSPYALRHWLAQTGWIVMDGETWSQGQIVLCQRSEQ